MAARKPAAQLGGDAAPDELVGLHEDDRFAQAGDSFRIEERLLVPSTSQMTTAPE